MKKMTRKLLLTKETLSLLNLPATSQLKIAGGGTDLFGCISVHVWACEGTQLTQPEEVYTAPAPIGPPES